MFFAVFNPVLLVMIPPLFSVMAVVTRAPNPSSPCVRIARRDSLSNFGPAFTRRLSPARLPSNEGGKGETMSVTVDLRDDEIAQIKRLTGVDSDSAAIAQAAREFLRLAQLKELKTASGTVDYQENWHSLEALELKENPPASEP